MRIIFTILAVISVVFALALSILPFGNLAFIPIIIGFIFSLLASKWHQKEQKSTGLIKALLLGLIIALATTIYKSVFTTNEVVIDEQTIEKEKQSEKDAIEELDDIEIN
jgi:uncharacterized membrane protein YeaQ/YmgE (transglycosylase-associated protein family)